MLRLTPHVMQSLQNSTLRHMLVGEVALIKIPVLNSRDYVSISEESIRITAIID